MDEKDKLDCFARINKDICNALTIKNCKNCNFYKCKKDVPNYSQYLKKGTKELLQSKEKELENQQ